MDSRILTSIGLAMLALTGLNSCQRQELDPVAHGHANIVFSAHAENDVTKAAIAENETSATFIWAAGDAVGLSDGANVYKAELNAADAGKANAGFTVTEAVSNPSAITFAGYPHSSVAGKSVTYPALYENYTSGSVVSPMLAVMPEGTATEGGAYDYGSLAFKHIGGMVKVVADNVPEGVDAMVFTANGNVTINGTAQVKAGFTEEDILGNSWKSGDWADGTSSVEFRFTAVAAGTDMTFFVPVPEGTAFTAEGFTIVLKKGETEAAARTFPFKEGYKVGRAKILRGLEVDAPATVKVKMNTTTLKEYAPTKVVMYNDADGMKAGTAVSAVPETVSRFQAKANQSFTLSVLPSDYNMEDFWVVVELKRTGSDNHLLYIPTKHSNIEFTSGGNVVVDLSGLDVSMNDAEWYVAGDERLLPAEGYAYGDANTYFIQCKNGKTYKNATYTVNASIPDQVVIDYRARGNFFNVEEPKDVTFEWFKLSNGTEYTPQTMNYVGSSGVEIAGKFSFTSDAAAKTVTVKNDGAYAGAPILIMKKGDKILWGWTFWNIAADGTTIDPITVGSYQYAPMNIGQSTTQAATWIANKSGSNPDPIYRTNYYYQWGRYLPIFWTTTWSVDGILDQEGRVPAIASQMTFKESLSQPVGMIVNTTVGSEHANWYSDTFVDTWGSNSTNKVGAKTVYDPCPKGWKIAPVPALVELAALTYTADETALGNYHVDVEGLEIVSNGRIQAKLNKGSTGVIQLGASGAATSSSHKFAGFWGNVCGTNQGQYLRYDSSSGTKWQKASINRSMAVSVRCVVDTENR